MSFISYSLAKSYSVLDTRICLKIPNMNHFEMTWFENSEIKLELYLVLELYNKDKEKVLLRGLSEQLLGTRYLLGGKI